MFGCWNKTCSPCLFYVQFLNVSHSNKRIRCWLRIKIKNLTSCYHHTETCLCLSACVCSGHSDVWVWDAFGSRGSDPSGSAEAGELLPGCSQLSPPHQARVRLDRPARLRSHGTTHTLIQTHTHSGGEFLTGDSKSDWCVLFAAVRATRSITEEKLRRRVPPRTRWPKRFQTRLY